MYLKQHGRCALCERTPEADKPLVVDHDHSDGRVRGLLCDRCNRGIGFLQDNSVVLKKAARYVTK